MIHLTKVSLGLLASLAITVAEDYVCPAGKTDTDIVVEAGDSFDFRTQEGAKYSGNVDCVVRYEMGETCAKMSFSCSSFKLGKGDTLFVKSKRNKKFRKTKFKTQKYEGDMIVRFKTNKKKNDIGAECIMRCIEEADVTTSEPTTVSTEPTTTTGSGGSGTTSSGGSGGSSKGYTNDWLRGEGPAAHVHEGIRLADQSGWVAIGETLAEDVSARSKVQVRRVDNEAATQWTTNIGDNGGGKFSVGYSVIEGASALYVGIGLWQSSSSKQMPAVVALNPSTGAVLWTKVLTSSNHGGVRSCIMDNTDIVCAGYINYEQKGFVFVADEGKPAVWRLNSNGDVLTEKTLNIEGMGQVAKIRKDATSGFVLCSTAYGVLGGVDRNVVAVVKLDNSLNVEWSQTYGLAGGESQVFDMLVDSDGNYLLGGHTTVGTGVVNWDYLALKVDSQTRQEVWRRTYGQPRGFDAQWIHDEMYGVAQDKDGNYLLLGGSGDEYTYSANGSGEWQGWNSDTWGSYLVVVSKDGDMLYQNFWGDKGGNNAGEWLSVDPASGEVMIYTDSDTTPGFGFLKLTPVQ